MNDHSASGKQTSLLLLNSLIFLSLLAIARALFCLMMPNIIGGWRVLNSDLDIALLSVPFVLAGYYFLIVRPHLTIGMLAVTPGLCYISAVSAYRLQVDIFHFGRHFPLIDNILGSMDETLGFDWVAYFSWVTHHKLLFLVLSVAYQSIWVQPVFLFILFALLRRKQDCFSLHCALPLSFAITCAVASFFPALGAYQFHGMSVADHPGIALEFTDQMTAPMMWLRQSNLPDMLPSFPDMRLVTFPSWHAAAAVIFVLAAWPVKRLRYLLLGLNILMLMATPVQGSHYVSDMIIGATIGYMSFSVTRKIIAVQLISQMLDRKTSPNTKALPA